ncbi:autotransporter outer membrane beta-barrel domain-containing protein [Lysobacter enzymogenes]|uniref:autotransporter family protein n=1 Tax=Lysobacter enzymogenes TaxID=69 RepID=UPI00384A6D3A
MISNISQRKCVLASALASVLLAPCAAGAVSGQQHADGTAITLSDNEYTTANAGEHALWASNGGNFLTSGTARIAVSTTGDDANGIFVEGATTLSLSNFDVRTQGKNAHALMAQGAGASISFDQGSLSAATGLFSPPSFALRADAGSINIARSTVTGDAIALNKGRIGMDAVTFNGSLRVENGSSVTVSRSTVDGGLGAYSDAAQLEVSDTTINRVSVPNQTQAALASVGVSTVILRNSRVNGSGTGMNGLFVVDSGMLVDSSTIVMSADQGAALYLSAGTGGLIQWPKSATVTLKNTAIDVNAGAGLVGVVASTGNTFLTMEGGRLKTTGGAAIVLSQRDPAFPGPRPPATGHSQFSFKDGAVVSGGSGVLMSVLNDVDVAVVSLDTNASAYGDIKFAGNADTNSDGTVSKNVEVALRNGSLWQGAANAVRALSIASGARWNVTGDSEVGRTILSNGVVAFAAPTTGDFKTLTVNGDFEGASVGGTLVINTVLGDDASKSDKLIVRGNTWGWTSITVNNVGGTGAQTVDGIQVVRVDGTSNGGFGLNGRVVAGAYEYLLYKGSVADPNNGDWYLRSQRASTGPRPLPPGMIYRPETGAYLANQAAAVAMFQHSLQDRNSETTFGDRGERDFSTWMRVVRREIDGYAGLDQLSTGTDTSVIQIGGDMGRWNGDSRWHLGLMGGVGRADTQVDSDIVGYRAKGKVDGYNLGVYATWFANATDSAGLYLDGAVQYGRYNHSVRGDLLAEEKYKSKTWSASLETGYAFALNPNGGFLMYLEPQLQLIHTDYSADTHRESNGTRVDARQAGGLTSRVGVRFYGHSDNSASRRLQPFLTLNWWRNGDRNAIDFDNNKVELELPEDLYEAKLGLQAQFGGGWGGWGELNLRQGQRDYRDNGAQLGVSYRW